MSGARRFDGRKVIVTGASSGIGRATALRLANEGARVLLVARDANRLAEAQAELPGEGHSTHVCDVGDEASVIALMKELRAAGTEIDALAHLAGAHAIRPLQFQDQQSLLAMLAANVGSGFALVRALVTERVASKNGCSVVWTSSVAALRGGVGESAYAAAKGAVISAARSLAVEFARRRMRVNVVVPGVVTTPQSEAFLSKMTDAQRAALEARHLLGFGRPDDVAASIAFLLSDDARWITGTALVVDGGLSSQ